MVIKLIVKLVNKNKIKAKVPKPKFDINVSQAQSRLVSQLIKLKSLLPKLVELVYHYECLFLKSDPQLLYCVFYIRLISANL